MSDNAVRVLFVEDNPQEAELIQFQLAQSKLNHFLVEHYSRVADAQARLRQADFDVVLLDMNLPDCTGMEGIRAIESQVPDTPIIMLSNVNDEQVAERAVRCGAQDYLIKRDVATPQLTRAIRHAIERQRTENALRDSEERYALAVAGANDGIWDWDLTRDTVHYSQRWRRILDYDSHEMGASSSDWLERVHPDDQAALHAALSAHLDGATPHFEHEYRIRNKHGVYLWVLSRGLAVHTESGKAYRMAGSMTDVTLRKNAEEQFKHSAFHDALTGLPNRTLFVDRLALAIKQFQRDGARIFAVLYFDLDRFKNINDSLGHSAGDELLIAVARRLEMFLRPGDTLARLGGDEFAILLNELEDVLVATQVAERIHELLSQEFVLQGNEVFTSASIGIAINEKKYALPEELLRDADLAMYRAKQSGSTCCEIFDSDMHKGAVKRLEIETNLRRALDRGEFTIHYQPIVSVVSGRIMSFEALLRWQHPQHGLLYPDTFIREAEDTGLIVPICWWVLNQVCAQLIEWQRLFPIDPPISVSVNISGKLFRANDMADRLLAIIAAHGLEPASLRIEITESAIMDHREAAITQLTSLRAAGIELHIDDFGTGYSSLSYLQRFSYDTLKIDRSFVGMMRESGDSEAIVRAIVALGKMLNMNVVAEGVETARQLDWLRDIGCPEAQGFLFSKPMDDVKVSSLLQMQHPTEQ